MTVVSEAFRLARYAVRVAQRPRVVVIKGVHIHVPETARGSVLASIYSEKYEGLEIRALPRYLREDDIIVEAGAAIGFLGIHCAKVVGTKSVHMIEANADLVPMIERNFALNGYPEPITYNALAAAGEGGPVDFHVVSEFWSSSVIDRGRTERVDRVEQIDLNRLFRETGATVFICDIEGGEFALLPQLDLSTIRLVVIELHDHLARDGQMDSAVEYFRDSGFALAECLGNEVYVFTRDVGSGER